MDQSIKNLKKPIVHAYFLCYNEETILPHLIRHYLTFCDKVTIVDNHSTDKSKEIVESFPNTEFIVFDSENEFNDHSNIEVKNNVWKKSIGVADYVILGDTDEFLYHKDMKKFISNCYNSNITVIIPEGYHMIADLDFTLEPNDNVFKLIKDGIREPVLDKPMMFDCNKIKEINYSYGAHFAKPEGEVKILKGKELKMLHYKFLGIENFVYRNAMRRERLSGFNKKYNLGLHYLYSDKENREDYFKHLIKRTKILD